MEEIHRLTLRQAADASDRAAPDRQRILEPGGEKHPDLGAAPGNQRIGRYGGAMGEDACAGKYILDRRVHRGRGAAENVENAAFRRIGRRKRLVKVHRPVLSDHHEVGKRTAGIDADIRETGRRRLSHASESARSASVHMLAAIDIQRLTRNEAGAG